MTRPALALKAVERVAVAVAAPKTNGQWPVFALPPARVWPVDAAPVGANALQRAGGCDAVALELPSPLVRRHPAKVNAHRSPRTSNHRNGSTSLAPDCQTGSAIRPQNAGHTPTHCRGYTTTRSHGSAQTASGTVSSCATTEDPRPASTRNHASRPIASVHPASSV